MNFLLMKLVVIPLIENILLFQLFDHLLTWKFKKQFKWVLYACACSLIPFYIFIQFVPQSNTISVLLKPLNFILLFFLAIYFYRDSLRKKLLVAFLFLAITAISEYIVNIGGTVLLSIPMNEFVNNSNAFIIAMLSTKLVMLFIVELIIRRTRKYTYIFFSYHRELFLILSMNFVFIAITFVVTFEPTVLLKYSSLIMLFISFCMVCISIVSCYLIMQIARRSKLEVETQLRMQHMEMEMKVNEDLSIMVDKFRSLRHDMNNHIGVMLGLSGTKQYDELNRYLSDMYQDVSVSNDFIFAKNKTLMILLNNKLNIALAKNVRFEPQIELSDLPLPEMDLCSLLGNILDNAIEAASQVQDNPYVKLQLKKKGSQYFIYCENSFAVKPTRVNGTFITTKKEASCHGIGLANIEYIVKQYNGVLDISYEDVFQITIILDLEDSNA